MTSLPRDVRYIDFYDLFSAISASSAVNSFWLRLRRAMGTAAANSILEKIGNFAGEFQG
jgi:hypothetical protein